jgi:hypothetical protein
MEYHRCRRALDLARQAIARHAWGEAIPHLDSLGWVWRAVDRGEVSYLTGVCYRNLGKHEVALASYRSVPSGSAFEVGARSGEAEFLLLNWQFRAVEDLLLPLRARGKPDQKQVLQLLVRLGRMEARFDEVRAWLQEGMAYAEDPIGLLRQLWSLDRGAVATDGLRNNLEQALAWTPDDDRVWLGLARVDILDGHLEAATRWLTCCQERRPGDLATQRALLDRARLADRTDQVAGILAGPLASALSPLKRLAMQAWLAGHLDADAERRALQCWLEVEPSQPTALEQLATLAAEAHDLGLAAALRRRKNAVDRALDRYDRGIRSPGGSPRRRSASRWPFWRTKPAVHTTHGRGASW